MRRVIGRILDLPFAPTQPERRDLFISYASEDRLPLVHGLSCVLAEMEVSFWYDQERIEPGGWFQRRMYEGLFNSNFVLVCMSSHYMHKRWTVYELKTALRWEKRERRQIIIPISITRLGVPSVIHPALKDRSHLKLDLESVRQTAAKIRQMVYPTEKLQPVELPIKGTNLRKVFFPHRFLAEFRELSHRELYKIEYMLRLLRECGILVAHTPGSRIIEMNGASVEMIDPANLVAGWGGPGIWAGDVVRAVYTLLSGADHPPSATYAGVGPNYRAALNDIEEYAGKLTIAPDIY